MSASATITARHEDVAKKKQICFFVKTRAIITRIITVRTLKASVLPRAAATTTSAITSSSDSSIRSTWIFIAPHNRRHPNATNRRAFLLIPASSPTLLSTAFTASNAIAAQKQNAAILLALVSLLLIDILLLESARIHNIGHAISPRRRIKGVAISHIGNPS